MYYLIREHSIFVHSPVPVDDALHGLLGQMTGQDALLRGDIPSSCIILVGIWIADDSSCLSLQRPPPCLDVLHGELVVPLTLHTRNDDGPGDNRSCDAETGTVERKDNDDFHRFSSDSDEVR